MQARGEDRGDVRSEEDRQALYRAFTEEVNMTPKELEGWLETPESHSVGMTRAGEDEAVGHASGRAILAIRRKKKAELDEADYDHMAKVLGYIHRHRAQGPSKSDPERSRWRFSLMNWGHDPLKDAE